ncbi:MAG: hypothetical protein ACXVQR_01840 [Solirubrobacteraceae bacterium]
MSVRVLVVALIVQLVLAAGFVLLALDVIPGLFAGQAHHAPHPAQRTHSK